MRNKGLIHLYHGDGKGKTTCAMGLALRCAGHHYPVVIVQFLKDGTSGECRLLAKMENVTLLAVNPVGKFFSLMTAEEQAQTKQAAKRTFDAAVKLADREQARMLVLDEICAAISLGIIAESEVTRFLDSKPEGLEVVMTGRDPGQLLIDRADYISEICKRRHPFDKGIAAREGIEK